MGNLLGQGGIGGTVGDVIGVKADTSVGTIGSGTSDTTSAASSTASTTAAGTTTGQSVSSQVGGQTTTGLTSAVRKEKLELDDAAVQKIIQDVLGGAGGLKDIFSQEQGAGIFNSSVAAQAAGDLASKLVGEIAKLTGETTITDVGESEDRQLSLERAKQSGSGATTSTKDSTSLTESTSRTVQESAEDVDTDTSTEGGILGQIEGGIDSITEEVSDLFGF